MLLDNDLDAYTIQDFCVETLNESIEYQAFCTDLLGATLAFETDSRIDKKEALPALPYCVSYAGDEDQDLRVQEWGHSYQIVLVFAIQDDRISITENGIKKYTESRSVEKLAKKAIQIIKPKMRETGINGDFEIDIVEAGGEKTPTGEEDDIIYILNLTFAYLDDINK